MTIHQHKHARAAGIVRAYLRTLDIELKHSSAIRVVARIFGFTDWQELTARLEQPRKLDAPMLHMVSPSSYRCMDMGGKPLWITVGNISVYVRPSPTGVAVELFPLGAEFVDQHTGSRSLSFDEALKNVCQYRGVEQDEVADWVGSFYGRDFTAESPASQVEWVNHYADSTTLMEKVMIGTEAEHHPEPRYVHGTWRHAFDLSLSKTTVRLVYDRHEWCLVHMDIETSTGWVHALDDSRQEMEHHLQTASVDAIDNPQKWGLEASRSLPTWVKAK